MNQDIGLWRVSRRTAKHNCQLSVAFWCLVLAAGSSFAYGQTVAPSRSKPSAPTVASRPTSPTIAVQKELTVGQIVELLKAGLGEDLLIAEIKKNGKPFDLSLRDLLALKQAGASDHVIQIMKDPSANITAPAPASFPPQTSALPMKTSTVVQASKPTNTIPDVDDVGFYLFIDSDKPLQLTATTFGKQKVGMLGALGAASTMGIKKIKQTAEIRGTSSHIRTGRRPKFLLYAPEGMTPTDYLLICLDKSGGSRKATIGTMGITGVHGGFDDNKLAKFGSEKIGSRKYVISFESELPVGEYAFFPAAGITSSGEMMTVAGKLYDFGVD